MLRNQKNRQWFWESSYKSAWKDALSIGRELVNSFSIKTFGFIWGLISLVSPCGCWVPGATIGPLENTHEDEGGLAASMITPAPALLATCSEYYFCPQVPLIIRNHHAWKASAAPPPQSEGGKWHILQISVLLKGIMKRRWCRFRRRATDGTKG